MSEWISVDKLLPNPGIDVLVYSKAKGVTFSHRLWMHPATRPFAIEYVGEAMVRVTHWMPLPEPPKGD